MKAFVRLSLLFSLLIAATIAAGELYVRSLPNPARYKHEWMLRHSRGVRTLVLGSSHTFYGIDPALLGEDAFSLAMVSQTYRYDDYLLRNYPTDSLTTVILPFSYFSLYEDYEIMQRDPQYVTRYLLYMDCPYHSPLSRYGFEFMEKSAFTERLKSLWQPPRLQWTALGAGANYRLELRGADWDNGEARALKNTYADHRAVKANILFLHSIFSWCRSRRVRVLLISTPLSPIFRQHESVAQVALNRRVLHSLLRQYPEVEYHDFESDPRFTDADFFDADHLSDRGAARLSLILRRLMAVGSRPHRASAKQACKAADKLSANL